MYVEAPTNIALTSDVPSIFLAGTIDNGDSFDWQKNISIRLFNEFKNDVDILNPRRAMWGDLSEESLTEQINWELTYLQHCDVVFMYITSTSKSPISLLELGTLLNRVEKNNQKLIVCCEPGFYRYTNVVTTFSFFSEKNNQHNNFFFTDYEKAVEKLTALLQQKVIRQQHTGAI